MGKDKDKDRLRQEWRRIKNNRNRIIRTSLSFISYNCTWLLHISLLLLQLKLIVSIILVLEENLLHLLLLFAFDVILTIIRAIEIVTSIIESSYQNTAVTRSLPFLLALNSFAAVCQRV